MSLNKLYGDTPYSYLKTPNYIKYIDLIQQNMKTPPYYTLDTNNNKKLPIMYNYVDPLLPQLPYNPIINSKYQFWYTPQE